MTRHATLVPQTEFGNEEKEVRVQVTHMLSRAGAWLQVFLELRRRYGLRSGLDELVILDKYTIERPWGWVFFWTTRGWAEGDMRYAVGGNGPIMINRFDCSMQSAGTDLPIEHYIEEYESELRQAGRIDRGNF